MCFHPLITLICHIHFFKNHLWIWSLEEPINNEIN